jgi:hypothetical protein
MKRLLFSFSLALLAPLLAASLLLAQTVENIRVEQEGEKLNIHYRIGGSTTEQLYFVTLTCSVDGGTPFEPVSVIGDVGANIRGGKSYNTIVWSVFNDLEEIGNVEFFVRVDLTSDEREKAVVGSNEPKLSLGKEEEVKADNAPAESPGWINEKAAFMRGKSEEPEDEVKYRKNFIGYEGSSYNPLGFRIGTVGNWGMTFSMRYGGYDVWFDEYYITMTAGVTKRFYQMGKYRLHGYMGLGIGYHGDETEIDMGLIVVLNRLNINIGATANQYYGDGTVGIGFVF